MKKPHVSTPIIPIAFIFFLLFSFSLLPAFTHAAITDGLISYWTFDEGSGTTAGDSNGSGNIGTLTNGPTWATGANAKVGSGALNFDGVDDYVNIGDPTNGSLDFGTGSFSYGMWIYATGNTGAWDMPWNKGGAASNDAGYDIELGTGAWLTNISDGAGHIIAANFTNPGVYNKWVHIFVVVDRSTNLMFTYLNGAVANGAGADISTVGSVSNSSNANIGNRTTTYPFIGRIDDVRVYNRALSASEVLQLYKLGGAKIKSN